MSAKRPALAPLLVQWQARLRLLDWQITAEYVGPHAEGFGSHFGDLYPDPPRKFARVRLLDPKLGNHPNVESTLLHELVHLHLYPFTKNFAADSHESLFEEQAVNAITQALLEAYGEA